jgi:LysM repeat protein
VKTPAGDGTVSVPAGTQVTDEDSKALGNAMESYKRQGIYGQRIDQDIANTERRIKFLTQAKNEYKRIGAVDEARNVEIQITNLQNRVSDLKDAKAGNQTSMKETEQRIGELQKGVAYKSDYTALENTEREVFDEENNLKIMLQRGILPLGEGKTLKETYLDKQRDIIQKRVDLYKAYGKFYDTYDKTNKAAGEFRDAARMETNELRKADLRKTNKEQYELVEDKEGNIEIKDVFNDVIEGTLNLDYVEDNGIYRRLIIPRKYEEELGGVKFDTLSGMPASLRSEVLKATNPELRPFVFKINSEGKRQKITVNFENNKPVMPKEVKMGEIPKPSVGQPVDYLGQAKSILSQVPAFAKSATEKALELSPAYRQSKGLPAYSFTPLPTIDMGRIFQGAKDTFSKLMQNIAKTEVPKGKTEGGVYFPFGGEKTTVGNILQGVGQGFTDVVQGAKNILGKIFAPRQVQAAEGTMTSKIQKPPIQSQPTVMTSGVGKIIDNIANKYAPGDEEFRKVMHAIALAESGGNPNAQLVNAIESSYGLYQANTRGGRGTGYKPEDLLNPEFNANLAAKELIYYYNQGRKQGLTGADLVAYVSRYGQRPAAGNEWHAAKRYGQYVGGGQVKGTSVRVAPKSTRIVTPTPTPTSSPNFLQKLLNIKKVEAAAPSYLPNELQPTEEYDIETVKPGDTLSAIAQKYGTDYNTLAALSGIRNPNLIYPGQKIYVPKPPPSPELEFNQPAPTLSAGGSANLRSQLSGSSGGGGQGRVGPTSPQVQQAISKIPASTFKQPQYSSRPPSGTAGVKFDFTPPKTSAPSAQVKPTASSKPNVFQQAVQKAQQVVSNAGKAISGFVSNIFKRK